LFRGDRYGHHIALDHFSEPNARVVARRHDVKLLIGNGDVERTVEYELLPMAQALGLGVLPWSPLGGGILTGKYGRSDLSDENGADVSQTRKGVIASTGHLTERSLSIAEVIGAVGK
jgi:aryl-alcohol dehydrogenase-like predicted oxidoreductase